MENSNHTRGSAKPGMSRNLLGAGVLVLLSILFLGASSASALPIATQDKCSSSWVNNSGALKCVDQEEQDVLNNVKHPHYVACTSDGTLYCCADNDQGGQDCDAIEAKTQGTRSELADTQLEAELTGIQTTTSVLGQIQIQLKNMKAELDNLSTQCGQPPIQ